MSAQAHTPGVRAEHVLLESDDADDTRVPGLDRARRIQAGVKVHSRVRGSVLELDVFDYRYLSVRSRRPWSDPRAFVVELRFVNPTCERTRNVPKRWWQAAAASVLLSVIAAWLFNVLPQAGVHTAWFAPLALLCAGSICAVLLSVYLTTETVVFRSAHGGAKLLEFTGGLGTFRALRAFETKLAAHIRHAVAARGRAKGQHLRDEMREHQRLKDLGVLPEQEYEESKARILRSHD